MVRLKIAIAGTRGIPARYGGFETFAEELSARLVERGHEVWVYCRAGSGEWGVGSGRKNDAAPTPHTPHPTPEVKSIVLLALRHNDFEYVSDRLLCALDALRRDFDGVLLCIEANVCVLTSYRVA